jgi:hypothetical protein
VTTPIVIQVGDESFEAELDETRAPNTVRAIVEALPLQARSRQWGDEIYFEVPVDVGREDAQPKVGKGDLGYWPDGNCFCIFYGKTPMSPSEEEIVPASPVNVIGTIQDCEALKEHGSGEDVVVRAAD